MDEFDTTGSDLYMSPPVIDTAADFTSSLPGCEICKSSSNQKDLYHCGDCKQFYHWSCQGRSADDPEKPSTSLSITCDPCRDMTSVAPKIDAPITKRKRSSITLTPESTTSTASKKTKKAAEFISDDDSADSADEDIDDALHDLAIKQRKIQMMKAEAAAANLQTSARKLAQVTQSSTPTKPVIIAHQKPASNEKRSLPVIKNQSPVKLLSPAVTKSPSQLSGPMLLIKQAIGGPDAEKFTQAISAFTNQHFAPAERRNCLSRLVPALKSNDSLRKRLYDGTLTAEQLCVMPIHELQSEEQQREREEESKAQLQQLVIKDTTIAKHTKEGIQYISIRGDKLERIDAFAPSPDDETSHNSDDHIEDDDHDNGLPFLEHEQPHTDVPPKSPSLNASLQPLSNGTPTKDSNGTSNHTVSHHLSSFELSSQPLNASTEEIDAEAASLPSIGAFVPDDSNDDTFDMIVDDDALMNKFSSPTIKSEAEQKSNNPSSNHKSETINKSPSLTNKSLPSNSSSTSASHRGHSHREVVDLIDSAIDDGNTSRPLVKLATTPTSRANAQIDARISSDSTSFCPVSMSIAARLMNNQLRAHSEWKSCFTWEGQNIAFTGYLMGVAGQADDDMSLDAIKSLPSLFNIKGRSRVDVVQTVLNEVCNAPLKDRIASLYYLYPPPEEEDQMRAMAEWHESRDRVAVADCRLAHTKKGLMIYIGRLGSKSDPGTFHSIFSGVARVKEETPPYFAVVIYFPDRSNSGRSSSRRSSNQPPAPTLAPPAPPAVVEVPAPVAPVFPAAFPPNAQSLLNAWALLNAFQQPQVNADGTAPQYPLGYPTFPGMPLMPSMPPVPTPPAQLALPAPVITPPTAQVSQPQSFTVPSPYAPYNSNSSSNSNSQNTHQSQSSNQTAAAQFLSTIRPPPQQQQQHSQQQHQPYSNQRPISPVRGRSPPRQDDMRGRHSNSFSPRSQQRMRQRTPSPPPRGFQQGRDSISLQSERGRPMSPRRSRSPMRGLSRGPPSPRRHPPQSPPRGRSRGHSPQPPHQQHQQHYNRPRSPPRHKSPPRASAPSHHNRLMSPSRSPPRIQRKTMFSPNRSPPRQRMGADPRIQQAPPQQQQHRAPPSPQRQQHNPEVVRTSGFIHPSRIGQAPSR